MYVGIVVDRRGLQLAHLANWWTGQGLGLVGDLESNLIAEIIVKRRVHGRSRSCFG